MRKYIDYIIIGIKEHMVYSSSIWANFLSKIIYLYMQFSIWNALFASQGQKNYALNHADTLRYLTVATIISSFIECEVIAWINNHIQTGNIAVQLIRPIDFKAMVFSRHIGDTIVKIVFYCLPLCIISGFVIDEPLLYKSQLLYGFCSIILAYMIQFLYSLIIGLLAFWLIVTWPLNMLLGAIYKLLSGAWIPVAMFPDLLYKINLFLPFRAIYAIPVNIITSPMKLQIIYSDIFVQIIWLIILYALTKIIWKVGTKKLIVQGC
ncbi:MAG: ABC-2 family transporter protein [Lachnospiraceae bacterium]|nr:ABC-2 family transporter protein [Lachnospiraceae bacterium]